MSKCVAGTATVSSPRPWSDRSTSASRPSSTGRPRWTRWIANQDATLRQAAGQAFYDTSKVTFLDRRARARKQQLRVDVLNYLDEFSPNGQDILDNFEFLNQIPRLDRADALGRAQKQNRESWDRNYAGIKMVTAGVMALSGCDQFVSVLSLTVEEDQFSDARCGVVTVESIVAMPMNSYAVSESRRIVFLAWSSNSRTFLTPARHLWA